MRKGTISQTALKVATTMLTLDATPGWHERLPEGLADMTERLILAADVPGYGHRLLRVQRRPWVIRLSNAVELGMPGIFEGLGERKVFINARVIDALAEGARQVLVVGAGFDTLCLRLAPLYPDVRFVEIDHPATAAAKQRGVRKLGQPDNLTLLAVDLRNSAIDEVMADCPDWDTEARSVVIAEGLFLYLANADVRKLFDALARCTGTGSRVVFSHGVTVKEHRWANFTLQLMGEPWLSSCPSDQLAGYIGPNWSVITTQPPRTRRDLEGFAVAEKLS